MTGLLEGDSIRLPLRSAPVFGLVSSLAGVGEKARGKGAFRFRPSSALRPCLVCCTSRKGAGCGLRRVRWGRVVASWGRRPGGCVSSRRQSGDKCSGWRGWSAVMTALVASARSGHGPSTTVPMCGKSYRTFFPVKQSLRITRVGFFLGHTRRVGFTRSRKS
jgi:hypothetical protein